MATGSHLCVFHPAEGRNLGEEGCLSWTYPLEAAYKWSQTNVMYEELYKLAFQASTRMTGLLPPFLVGSFFVSSQAWSRSKI